MNISRRFTTAGTSPYDMFRYTLKDSVLRNQSGKEIFRMEKIEVPEAWSQVATDILAQKYFRKAGVPTGNDETGAETSVRQVVHRMAGCWRWWGEKYGYFDTVEDAEAFYDEMAYMLLKQMAAPNSPQWFNTGLNFAYGITGSAQGHYYVDPDSKKLTRSVDAYTHPIR